MAGALERNRLLYEDLWRHVRLFPHDGWDAWREIAPFLDGGARAIEIGPGKLPHLPPGRAVFVDISTAALTELAAAGGKCVRASHPLPFADGAFDVACAFELLEHVGPDEALLDEIARVVRPGGVLFLSCPMNPAYWTYYDKVIGHERRYRAAELSAKLAAAGFSVERTAARPDRMDRWFGALFGFGMRWFTRPTLRVVEHYLPKVAAMEFPWRDGASLDEAEREGGLLARARRR
jgi:SAM-dependent methyltransferase